MPATPLPSSGDQPERAPGGAGGDGSPGTPGAVPRPATRAAWPRSIGCSGPGSARAARSIDGVAEGDTVHAEVVADHLAMLSIGLHAHHEGEDTMLWDTLEQRAPSCAVHVERMKAQHAEMLVHLTALDAALPAWRASGRAADAAGVVVRARRRSTPRSPRTCPTRSANIVPVMETVITPEGGRRARRARTQGDAEGQDVPPARRDPRRAARRRRRVAARAPAPAGAAPLAVGRQAEVRGEPRRARGRSPLVGTAIRRRRRR